MTSRAPIVILDCETTGLNRADDEIWEFAALRRNPDGEWSTWHWFVEHDLAKVAHLPEPFLVDHSRRYDPAAAISVPRFVDLLTHFVFAVPDGTPYNQRCHVVGAVPDFDLAILERTIGRHGNDVPWNHHIQDVENLAVGWLAGVRAQAVDCGCDPLADSVDGPPWDSEALSRAVGVDPAKFARHTAMGDVLWAAAILAAVRGLSVPW